MEKLIDSILKGVSEDTPNYYNKELLQKHPLKSLELFRRGYIHKNQKEILSNILKVFFNSEKNGWENFLLEALRLSIYTEKPRIAFAILNKIDINSKNINKLIICPLLLKLSTTLFAKNSFDKSIISFRHAFYLHPYSIHNLKVANLLKEHFFPGESLNDVEALVKLVEKEELSHTNLEYTKHETFYGEITPPKISDNFILSKNNSIVEKIKPKNNKDFIYSVNDGKLLFKDGITAILDNNLNVAKNLSPHYYQLLIEDDLKITPFIVEGEVFIIHDRFFGPNYCHWLLDYIPRLISLHKYKSKKITIAIPNMRASFQKQTIDLLEDYIEKIIVLEDHPLIKFERLYFLSSSWFNHYHPAQGCNSILLHETSKILSKNISLKDNKSNKNIYISRNKSSGRRITNENELLLLLEKYDFKTFYLEDLSLKEQISLFKNAERVISPHGAGLTNLLFCKPNTKVLEIFNENYGTSAYHDLSSGTGLNYTCYNSLDSDGGYFSSDFNRKNIIVDCEIIERNWLNNE